jgi:hypothetical protein
MDLRQTNLEDIKNFFGYVLLLESGAFLLDLIWMHTKSSLSVYLFYSCTSDQVSHGHRLPPRFLPEYLFAFNRERMSKREVASILID